MTVEAIRLRNFMAFKDTEWVDLRPITLLFGRNSSGKSALIRGLLLLKRSLKSPDKRIPLRFASSYGPDYGSFKEVIHGGDDKSSLWFFFRCSNADIQTFLARLDLPAGAGSKDSKQVWKLQIGLGYAAMGNDEGNSDVSNVGLSDLTISAASSDGSSEVLLFATGLLKLNENEQYEGDWFLAGTLVDRAQPGSWLGFGCRVERDFLDIKFNEPNGGAPDGFDILKEIYGMLRLEIETFLDNIIHLGPIRPEPQRRYSFDRRTEIEWKEQDWTDFLDFLGGKFSQIEYEKLDPWLKQLGLAERAESRLTSETAELVAEYEVGIYETDHPSPRPLSAMGFGTSQVLPVIVQCARATPKSLIIVEQPELHLHPSAQAVLADLFVNTTRQNEKNENPRLLIETHSEHLILRLRRRMAEAALYRSIDEKPDPPMDSETLSVYFVDRDGPASSCEPVVFDEWGRYEYQPKGFIDFFGADFDELQALNEARLLAQQGSTSWD